MLHSAINQYKAQEKIDGMNVADFPKMKSEDRQRRFREIRNIAYPDFREKNAVSFDDLANKGVNKVSI